MSDQELGYQILDPCCGSKMFWFDKNQDKTIYMDIRNEDHILSDGRSLVISPDIVADFRDMPFQDNSFNLVIFDPPHLVNAGSNSWLAKKYGVLNKSTWKDDIKRGFEECWRVLRPGGTLIFKWNSNQIAHADVWKLFPAEPIVGDRRGETRWTVFYKPMEENNDRS